MFDYFINRPRIVGIEFKNKNTDNVSIIWRKSFSTRPEKIYIFLTVTSFKNKILFVRTL